MQDEGASRDQYHDTVQPSSGVHTSNVTSHHFLGGQQHRSWMVPIHSLLSVDQDDSLNTMAQQAQQVNRTTADLASNFTSESALHGARDESGVQLSDARRTTGAALDNGPHCTVDQSPMQIPPNKRPRLATQPQRCAFTVPEGQSAPLYSFFSSPVYSPSVHDPVMSSPLATSTTSPRIAAGPGSIHQGHSPNQAPMSRRQSSLRNMEISQQQSAQSGRTRTIPSVSPHPAQQQPITTNRTPNIMLQPRLQAAMADPLTGDILNKDWARQRFSLLEDACGSADWFYLTLHQIYCWRTLNTEVMGQLGFVGMRELELANLEPVLLPNTRLRFQALEWFSQFPTDQKSLLQGSSPEALDALKLVHTMLDKMSLHWPQLHMSCLARRYPPSPYELYEGLGMSSTVLQVAFFTFIFRQIEGADDQQWIQRAKQFFMFTQKQLIDKLTRVNQGLTETPPNNDVALAQFAKEYFDLQSQCASRPVFAGNALNVQSTAQTPAALPWTGTQPTIVPPALNSSATITQSRNPDHSVPPTHASQTPASGSISGVRTEVATNIPKRTISDSQPVALNNTQSTIGPRQQDFMQETMGVQAAGNFSVSNLGRRASGLSNSPAPLTPVSGGLRNVRNSSMDNRPPGLIPMKKNGRQTISSNSVPVTQQINHIPQQTTRLLPPAGKLMTQNTYPNPDFLALHQARLLTPEPSIPEVGKTQERSRLFQVFQRFVLPPQLITNQQSYYTWHINIPEIDIVRIARDVSVEEQAGRPAAKLKRVFHRGSLVYRLRCIKLTSGLHEADWTTAPTFWPASCFISLDAQDIELRRKSHWGRHLPCDLTRGIKAGVNIVEMSVSFTPEELAITFAIAIELIEVLDQLQCTQKLMLIEQPKSLAAIVASLITAANDDDIAIVDPHISIDLIDPFTAQIWKIPVRGKTCTHRECFDLEAFLNSRPSKHQGVPLSSADNWKCPICDKDARPQCLVLDGFLLSVGKQLRAGSDEGEEVRAIQVTADGIWKPLKAEKKDARKETSTRDDLANTTSARSTPSVNAGKETVLREARQESVIVIELDDD